MRTASRACRRREWRFHRDIYAARDDAQRDRAHAFAIRNDARLPRPRHSRVPLHGRGGGRHRHPLRAVRDVRHAGAVGSRGRARSTDAARACLSHHGMIAVGPSLDARAGAGGRSRNARRNVLARVADRRADAAVRRTNWTRADEVRRLRQGVTQPSSPGTSRSAQPLCNARRMSAFRWYGPCTPFWLICLSGVFRCALYVSSS